MTPSLRHLRMFLAAADTGSVTAAARACHVSQPAASQALARLQAEAGVPLLDGGAPTGAGLAFARRVRRALARLDGALAQVAPRLPLTTTRAHLAALIALADTRNFTLAARHLGMAQPTIHRAITRFEAEAGRDLFRRAGRAVVPGRAALALADAARLSLAELEQASAELAEHAGREAGRIVIGAMPLSRSAVLPGALAAFRALRPQMPVTALDGPYDDLLAGLRRGEIDLLLGALRQPVPVDDVVQEGLFTDDLALIVRPGHPLARATDPGPLTACPWVVSRPGTPGRAQVDRILSTLPGPPPPLVETGSLILTRELVMRTDHVGCVSRLQAAAEAALGAVTVLPLRLAGTERPIGLTTRADWLPTPAQAQFVAILRSVAAQISDGR